MVVALEGEGRMRVPGADAPGPPGGFERFAGPWWSSCAESSCERHCEQRGPSNVSDTEAESLGCDLDVPRTDEDMDPARRGPGFGGFPNSFSGSSKESGARATTEAKERLGHTNRIGGGTRDRDVGGPP